MTYRTNTARPLRFMVGALTISLAAACGGSESEPDAGFDAGSSAGSAGSATESTVDTTPVAATTTPATPSPPTAPPTVPVTVPATVPPTTSAAFEISDETAGAIEEMLAASITDFVWNCCGADAPPTGAAIAIRVPGAADALIATGNDVDGGTFDPAAPFLAGSLGISLVQSVAFELIDAGTLDPAATVDTWVPTIADASVLTVQDVLDNATGWGDFDGVIETYVVPDLTRVWTLPEVVDVAATIAPTGSYGGDLEATVLGHILEQVTGKALADLVTEYVAGPLGLDHTTIGIDAPKQPGYQHGVFVLDGTKLDTASVPTDAYYSFLGAAGSASSTLPDLLDLLDGWVTGDLLGADRAATPDHFQPDNASPDSSTTIIGLGVPVNGYCDPRTGAELEYPCNPADDGLNVMAIGRTPNAVGTTLFLWHFPTTGVSLAMHYNSNEWITSDDLAKLALDIHDLVTASA